VLEPCRDEELTTDVAGRKAGKTLSHERPLTAALFNSQFNQVTSIPSYISRLKPEVILLHVSPGGKWLSRGCG
jgi:hypothetical protein